MGTDVEENRSFKNIKTRNDEVASSILASSSNKALRSKDRRAL